QDLCRISPRCASAALRLRLHPCACAASNVGICHQIYRTCGTFAALTLKALKRPIAAWRRKHAKPQHRAGWKVHQSPFTWWGETSAFGIGGKDMIVEPGTRPMDGSAVEVRCLLGLSGGRSS